MFVLKHVKRNEASEFDSYGLGSNTEQDIIDQHITPILSEEEGGAPDVKVVDEEQTTDDDNKAGEQTTEAPAEPNKAAQQQEGKQKPDTPATEDRAVKFDKQTGNIVDAKTGEVVASRGSERRLYEKAQRLEKQSTEKDGEIVKLRQDLATAQSQTYNGLPTQLGLDQNEVMNSLRLMANFKTDPVKTVQYLLSEVAAMGYNIDGVGQGVDMQAVTRLIDSKLSPITDREDQAKAEAKALEDATVAYNGFIERHPDATIHEEAIARLLTSDKSLTVEAAYFQLKSLVLEKGLDWNKPLAEQVRERQQAQVTSNTPQPQQQQVATGQAAPMPRGSNTTGAVQEQGQVTIADPDTSFDEIVLQSMRESGMRI